MSIPANLPIEIHEMVRTEWLAQDVMAHRARYYWDGAIFLETVRDDPDTLIYPIRVNLIRALIEKLQFFFWGQRNIGTPKHRIFKWEVEGNNVEAMQRVLDMAYKKSRGDTLFQSLTVDAMVDGITFVRPRVLWDGTPRLTQVLWANCKPIFDPFDHTELTGAVFHYQTSDGEYCEVYRPYDVIQAVGKNEYRMPNVHGLVPFVPFTLFRTGASFCGEPFPNVLFGIQNEINARLADAGDSVNNEAHPTKVIANTNVSVDDLETGADALWNLGLGPMGQDPKAWLLTSGQAASPSIQLTEALRDILDIISHIPDVAQGHTNGSQRSSKSLGVRLETLVNAMETWRSFVTASLIELAEKTLKMVITGREVLFLESPGYTAEDVENATIHVRMNPVLRKDDREVLDWNMAAVQSYLKSQTAAMRDIGIENPEEQQQEILDWLLRLKEAGVAMQSVQTIRTTRGE